MITLELDKFELYYLLESCFRGSHLRANTITRYIDEIYPKLTARVRKDLYEWILRDIYDGEFKPRPQLCGEDIKFMARYNPDNQYVVVYNDTGEDECVNCYLLDGKYYVKSNAYVAPEFIRRIAKTNGDLKKY